MKPPVKKVARDRALKKHEIKALWPVLAEMGYPFGSLQQLLLLLGQRRSEVAEMQWCEVDTDKREWTIPAGSLEFEAGTEDGQMWAVFDIRAMDTGNAETFSAFSGSSL